MRGCDEGEGAAHLDGAFLRIAWRSNTIGTDERGAVRAELRPLLEHRLYAPHRELRPRERARTVEKGRAEAPAEDARGADAAGEGGVREPRHPLCAHANRGEELGAGGT